MFPGDEDTGGCHCSNPQLTYQHRWASLDEGASNHDTIPLPAEAGEVQWLQHSPAPWLWQ